MEESVYVIKLNRLTDLGEHVKEMHYLTYSLFPLLHWYSFFNPAKHLKNANKKTTYVPLHLLQSKLYKCKTAADPW